jgi:hypothetical protein
VLALPLAVAVGANAPSLEARPMCHPILTDRILQANLDRDAALENVLETAGPVDCAHTALIDALAVEDACGGSKRTYWVGSGWSRDRAEIVEADARRGRSELFYVLRKPASRRPDIGSAGIVHLAARTRRACPRPRFLFAYRADAPPVRPPPGATPIAFDVTLANITSRYRGQEVRIAETFADTAGERRRLTFLRYRAAGDRYVVYAVKPG